MVCLGIWTLFPNEGPRSRLSLSNVLHYDLNLNYMKMYSKVLIIHLVWLLHTNRMLFLQNNHQFVER